MKSDVNDISVKTICGDLHATLSTNPEDSGIVIRLHRDGYTKGAPLLFISCEDDELICRCWPDVTTDIGEKKIKFTGINDFFANEE